MASLPVVEIRWLTPWRRNGGLVNTELDLCPELSRPMPTVPLVIALMAKFFSPTSLHSLFLEI